MAHEIRWHIGCSGFYYKEWKELFYPKGLAVSKWFGFYANHINTLESNVSFYRFPSLSMLQKWYRESAPGFSFSVKAPRSITHFKKFKDCKNLLADFYIVIRDGLQEKLGCVLFQLPPGYGHSAERLQEMVSQLDPSFTNIIEFRHPDWWREDVYQVLADHNIAFCSMSHPKLPDQVICTSPVLYYRFHGVPELYKSPYTHDFINGIVDQITRCDKVRDVYLYFNNTMTTAAIEHVRYLQQKLQLHFNDV
jgi:uncharacterized protein YecE (DUF72 family)